MSVIRAQKAWIYFFIGYIIVNTIPWIFPALTELMENTTFGGIIEVGAIIVEVIAIIVLPLIILSKELFTPIEDNQPVKEITVALVILIFGILITYFGYFMIQGLASVMEAGLQASLFWIGIILTWVGTIILAPINHIIKASKT